MYVTVYIYKLTVLLEYTNVVIVLLEYIDQIFIICSYVTGPAKINHVVTQYIAYFLPIIIYTLFILANYNFYHKHRI